jgi:LacI family transcriptional regulator, galactose operon repressor
LDVKKWGVTAVNRFVKGSRRPTIGEVAALAGVSKTTVSHVLSGNRPVALATRLRVEKAIRELGYRPDQVARSMRTRRSSMVALIIPDITNPFYPVLARGLDDSLHPAGYRTFICNTDSGADQEHEYLADVLGRRVDGIVMVSYTISAKHLKPLHRATVPLVSVGSMIIDDPAVDVVMADDGRGGHDAAAWLLRAGHSRIAIIRGAPGTGGDRESGFLKAMADAAIMFDDELAVYGHWTRQGGAAAMRQLMSMPSRPTAVFCCNDLMALGALDVAADLGLSVPQDVAVMGYDDLEWSSLVRPRLTTVMNPAYDTGRSSGNLLLDRMSGRYQGIRRTVVLPCQIVTRESA